MTPSLPTIDQVCDVDRAACGLAERRDEAVAELR